MSTIAIHSRAFQADKIPILELVFLEVHKRNVSIIINKDLAKYLATFDNKIANLYQKTFSKTEDLKDVDFIFSIGGDGTLLEAITLVKSLDIPILGINAGRLGFLATVTGDEIKQSINAVFKGFYSVEHRALIQVDSNQEVFKGLNFGLNEFAILKRDTSSMIVVHAYLDGEYLNSYWADGLIIATPTGSTGYSLSVGGPVVIPNSNNFIISPVSPHNLNVRPLVVSDNSVISFEIEGRSKNFLISLDSRSQKVDASIQLAIRKCDFKIGLIKLKDNNFLNTLRLKLNWGLDARN